MFVARQRIHLPQQASCEEETGVDGDKAEGDLAEGVRERGSEVTVGEALQVVSAVGRKGNAAVDEADDEQGETIRTEVRSRSGRPSRP
jgi:hypothetical protein